MAAGEDIEFKIQDDKLVVEKNNRPFITIKYDTLQRHVTRLIDTIIFSNYVILFEKLKIKNTLERYVIKIVKTTNDTVVLDDEVSKETFESIFSDLSNKLYSDNTNNNDPINPVTGGRRRVRKTKKRRVSKKKMTKRRR